MVREERRRDSATFHPAAVLRGREKLRPAAEDFRKLAAARRALEEARLREREPARAGQLYLEFPAEEGDPA